jgi:hypothetical protein
VPSGTLSAPGEVDDYSFTAASGTLVYFDGQSNDSTKRISLLKPNSTNNFVFSGLDAQSDSGAYQLTQTGSYKLQVYGSPATPRAITASNWLTSKHRQRSA